MAVRDRFGVKPLYYAQVGDTLYLASEAKALFAAGVPARWDHESFFQLSHLYFDQDRSLFDGMPQVPPGCYLLATQHHTQIVRYWDFDYPRIDDPRPQLSDAEHIERMRSVLDEAVRIRLRRRAGGCYLSGGLDSCALLGIAATHRTDPIEAFTLCFDVDSYNEEFVAKEMAEHAARQFPPAADQANATGRQFFRRHLAQRNADGQSPRRRQVPAQPDGARSWLQGRADGRRVGRNPGRIRAFPP